MSPGSTAGRWCLGLTRQLRRIEVSTSSAEIARFGSAPPYVSFAARNRERVGIPFVKTWQSLVEVETAVQVAYRNAVVNLEVACCNFRHLEGLDAERRQIILGLGCRTR
jgi:hypothetical protein